MNKIVDIIELLCIFCNLKFKVDYDGSILYPCPLCDFPVCIFGRRE